MTHDALNDAQLSRGEFLRSAAFGGLAMMAPRMVPSLAPDRSAPRHGESAVPNVAVQWNDALLQAVRESRLGPPMVARALAIAHTCAFDAWAAYDPVAVGTRTGVTLRRPGRERTYEHKVEALSYAIYRAAVDLFPASKATVLDPTMASIGLDPGNSSSDPADPAGIGNLVAHEVLTFRHRDGANQLGDEPGGKPGIAYSDYTGYAPVNAAMDTRFVLDPSTVHDIDRWQPLTWVDATGALVTPGFIGAHWQRVRPFAMGSSDGLRPPPPSRFGSAAFVTQAEELVAISAALTDEQKMIAEYWADGPRSETPPGHWNLLAQSVLERRRTGSPEHDLDEAVTLLFALNNAIFDAGCCAWDAKVAYDSVRPITAVRWLFRGTQIQAWAGPGKGTQSIAGEAWFPFQPTTFPTPPFGEHCSGHSAFSAAAAEILRLFTHSDRFGESVTFAPASSRIEPGVTPRQDITLSWPTFSDAAAEAGASRRYGGIHFLQADVDGRATGRAVAQRCWPAVLAHVNGTANRPK